jgi:hypothetical protein
MGWPSSYLAWLCGALWVAQAWHKHPALCLRGRAAYASSGVMHAVQCFLYLKMISLHSMHASTGAAAACERWGCFCGVSRLRSAGCAGPNSCVIKTSSYMFC